MFALSFDRAARIAVFLFTGDTYTDYDHEALVTAIERCALVQKTDPGVALCGISVVEGRVPIPDARWRARLARAASGFKEPAYYATVTDSPYLDSVIKAVRWLSGAAYVPSTFRTFDDALAWIEAQRGARLPMFRGLLADARAMAARGERLPPLPPI